jgi:hypothetical protein
MYARLRQRTKRHSSFTGAIRLYDNVLASDTCKAIIEKFELDPRQYQGTLYPNKINLKLKRCTDLAVSRHDDWKPLDEEIKKAVNTSLHLYAKDVPALKRHLMTEVARIDDSGYQLQRYLPKKNEGFNWHIDVGGLGSCVRYLAMILYLNTVKRGGETAFKHQGLKIKPKEGSILWFPPYWEYIHCGLSPVSGPKYIITTFLEYKE